MSLTRKKALGQQVELWSLSLFIGLICVILSLNLLNQAVADDESQKINTERLRSNAKDFFIFQTHHDPNYYVVLPKRYRSLKQMRRHVLSGRLESLHLLNLTSGGYDGDRKWSANCANPRVTGRRHAMLTASLRPRSSSTSSPSSPSSPSEPPDLGPFTLTITCPHYRDGLTEMLKNTLTALPDDRAEALLKRAEVSSRPRLPYRPIRLFRDEWGRYYLVEEINGSKRDQNRFRLWRGYRQAMKLIPTMHTAVDSEGMVLVSNEAAIRLVSSATVNHHQSNCKNETFGAFWVEEERRYNLLEVPVSLNQELIFNQLGIYDTLYLGTPCEPFYGHWPKATLPKSP